MMIVYELNSLFQNMNTFSQADFLLPQMADINVPFAAAKHGKFRAAHGACRNGLSTSSCEIVTRKKHSKEVDFQRKSSQCHVQEQESDRYKIVNVLHQVNASKKTVDNDDDVVRHCQETTETKIFILEKRYDAVPSRVVQMFWSRLKRLVGAGSSGIRSTTLSPKTATAVTTSQASEESTSGGGSSGGGSRSAANAVGLVVSGADKPSLDEIALNVGEGDDASSSIDAMKKKRNFFKKLVTKGRRNEVLAAGTVAATASNENENVFEPIRSVSDIVNDVQSKNRMLELIDANKKGLYQLPQVDCHANQRSTSDGQPDHNTVKKFFIMKFILARKKPSIQT